MSMVFVGVDLSWRCTPPKPFRSACATLDENGQLNSYTLISTDAEIVAYITSMVDGHIPLALRDQLVNPNFIEEGCYQVHGLPWPWAAASDENGPESVSTSENAEQKGFGLVGIDAPLVVPNVISNRYCEKLLLKCGFGVYPANRPLFSRLYGGIRGEELVRLLAGHGFPIVASCAPGTPARGIFEIYPSPAWRVLFGDPLPPYKNCRRARKIDGIRTRRELLYRNTLKPPLDLEHSRAFDAIADLDLLQLPTGALDGLGDILDAIIAAYTVYLYWKAGEQGAVVLGDIEKGYILTPKNDCLRHVAMV